MSVKFIEGVASGVFLNVNAIVLSPALIGGCSVGVILAGALVGLLMAKRTINKDLDE